MAEALNQAQTQTLAGTMPTLEQALQQAAQGLPPEALQQALGMGKAYDPMLAEQAARRTSELKPAEQAATAAERAYQQASAAPAPEVSGARAGLNELLSSVASIISGNQTYRESAATRLQKEQQALRDSRIENLTNLKEIYTKRAEAAKSLGNAIVEEENRLKKDRVDKQIDALNKAREQQYELERIHTQAAESRKTEAAKASAEAAKVTPQEMGQAIKTAVLADNTEVKYVDMRAAKDKDERAALRKFALENGAQIWNEQTAETVGKTQKTISDIDGIVENIQIFPRNGAGERMQDIVRNGFEMFTQTGNGVWLKEYQGKTRSAAISAVQTIASLGKGFRLNKAEIDAMADFDFPKVTDSQDVAIGKLEVLREMVSHVENIAIYGNAYRVSPEQSNKLVARYNALKAQSARLASAGRGPMLRAMKLDDAKEKDLGKPAAGGKIRVYNMATKQYGLVDKSDPDYQSKVNSGEYRIKGF